MGGSKGSQTSSTTSSLPPQVLQNYQNVVGQAQNVAATPYQQYNGQLVAPENSTEQQATTAAANAQGAYQPYFNTAQSYIGQGTNPITPTTVNASDINQYMSPYNQNVINATEAQMNQNDQMQQQQLTGNAIAAGAFGGDRAAVAASTLAGQQDLANNQTIAGLENQNYTQALGEANTQQQAGMTAQQANNANALQASGLTGALGNYAQQNQLSGASALMAAGQIGQQTQQNQNTAGYQQFEQQLAYPFQNTQYLANIVEGLGNQGGTSTTTQPSQQANGVLGFLGLKKGGAVHGYDVGGMIPDFESSYVPTETGGIGGAAGSSIPNAPSINNPQQPKATLNGVMNAGNGIATAAGYLGKLGPEAGYAMNAAGEGNAAYDAFAASDAAAAAGSMPSWMAAIASFLNTGGAVHGYADGGSPHEYATDGSVTPPPFSWGDPNTTGMGISGYNNSAPLTSTINQMAGLQNFTPIPVDFSKGYVPTSPQTSTIPQQSSIPTTPTIANSDASPTSPASTSLSGQPVEAPQSLTDLQDQLSKTAPVLDKDTAIWQGVAGALAGKNRGILQNVGEGLERGLDTYGGQKAAVADYALKEASAQKAAEQMAIEADRFKAQQDLAEKNFESEAGLRKAQADYMANGKESTSNREWDAFNSDPDNAGLSPTEKIQKYNQATAKPSTTQSASLANYFKSPDVAQNALTAGKVGETDLTPEANAKVERLLAGGNPTAISSKQDQRNDLLTLAHLRDPSYNENEYATRAAVEKANTGAGQIGKEYASFNTIMQHGPMVIQAANELGNTGSWTPGIKLGNYINQNLSDPRVKNLDSDIKLLAAEKAKMLSGQGVVTDAAREESNLRDYDSASELKSETMNTINQTLARARERQQQYITNMDGNDSDYIKKKADGFIQPDSREQLKKLGIPLQNFSGQPNPATSNNFAPSATNAAPQYTKGMTATGPNGAKMMFDGNQWVKQ